MVARGYKASIECVRKNNVMLKGIIIRSGFDGKDTNISPIIYEDTIRSFEGSIGDICDGIIKIYNKFIQDYEADDIVRMLHDKNYIPHNVRLGICRTDWNTEMLRDVPNRAIAGTDLSLYLRLNVGNGSARLKYSELKLVGFEEYDSLIDRAIENIRLEGFRTVFIEKHMAYPEVLNNIRLKMGCNRIIVTPSSVHEIIIFPGIPVVEESLYETNLRIKEVNSKYVKNEDVLSDHYYIFDGTEFI